MAFKRPRFKFSGDHQAADDITILKPPPSRFAPIQQSTDWQQDQPANRQGAPGKIFSYTNILQKSGGKQLNIETEEALLYYRSRRLTLDLAEVPINSGLLPRISLAMSEPPICVEVLNEDDTASIWVALDGDESSSPPPPNNIPTRLLEVIPGTSRFFRDIEIVQLDTVPARLRANGFPATGFLLVIAFDTSTTFGRVAAYFQNKAYVTDI